MTKQDLHKTPLIKAASPAWLLLLLGLLLTVLVYWPGLQGGYLFDDFPNIVDNRAVHVSELSLSQLQDATLASPSAELKRPLAMLSFGINHYFSGLAPLPMKLTNLVLHLLNGLLLFGLVQTLLTLCATKNIPLPKGFRPDLIAAVVALVWLLAPINLTPVLYVVQRMTSLAQVFVLSGLLAYLIGRQRQLNGRNGWGWILSGLLLGTALGLGAKEDAILLPAYALAVELAVLRFRTATTQYSGALIATLCILTLVPFLLGLAWLVPKLLSGEMYTTRPFTLGERLLTEPRVLIHYLLWTLLPLPGALSFYHDDIRLSTGLLTPPTTFAALDFLVLMLAIALLGIRKAPLLSLGLLWFFIAHSITATVIPLELVFEHRNYFASAGLFLAVLPTGLRWLERSEIRYAGILFAAVLVVWSAMMTAMRSAEWSNPVRLAYSEAVTHPNSARANYELGRVLVALSDYDPQSPLIEQAKQVLARAMSLPGAGILPEQALIMIAGNTQTPIDPKWWESMIRKLSKRPPSAEDVGGIEKLLHCQLKRRCTPEIEPMLHVFLTALGHPKVNPRLLVSYAQFAAFMLGDMELAERVANDALARGSNLRDIHQALEPVFDAVKSGHRPVTKNNRH